MNQDSGALTKKLAITTVGMASNALLDSEGISSMGTMQTPNATALTIMKTIAAI